ncbi:MAG: Bug family tripartite tricarboxylate transporter substrate binding protein [Burkholderiales bacterium]
MCLALQSIAVFLLALFTSAAQAQAWPTKTIEITVPYPPGGSSDVLGRLIGVKLQDVLKQPIVVFNRPGASTIIGTTHVAKAPADGYQLLLVDNPFLVNATVIPKLAYDPIKEFTPIAIIGTSPQLLFAPLPRSKTLAELIGAAKANPGAVSIGNASAGSLTHLLGVILENQAGVKFNHIPYKGSAPALQDAMGNQLDAAISSSASGLVFVTGGKLRVLAVTSAKRFAALPDVPTFEELGYKNMIVDNWWGLVAPAGTPKAVIDRIRDETAKAVALPDVRERYAGLGVNPLVSTPAEFQKLLEDEFRVWTKVAKDNNIKID